MSKQIKIHKLIEDHYKFTKGIVHKHCERFRC